MSSAAGEATRGSAIKLGAELLGRAAGVVTSLLIARGLGPAEFGIYAFLAGIAVLLAELGDLGLQGTAQRALVARSLTLRSMLRTKALLLAIPFALASLALLAAPSDRALGLRVAVLAPLLLYFVFAGWSEFLGVALRARGKRGAEAAVILCFRVCGLFLAALALGRGLGLAGLAWALALSPVAAIVLGFALLMRSGPQPPGDRLEATRSRDILRLAFPLALNGALALLSLRVEILILPFFASDQQTGLFAAALKIVDSLILVPAAIAAGAMPALTREAQSRQGPVRERTLLSTALFGVPGAVGLFALAPDIVSLLFGPEYAPAAGVLRLLAPALLAVFLNAVLLHALIALGRAPLLPRLTAVRVGTALLGAFTLIPALGIAGAGLGFTLSELVLLALLVRACSREGFSVPVARGVRLAAALSVPMALVLAFRWSGALVSIAVGGLTYAATLFAAWRLQPRWFSSPALLGQGRP